jgi:hypothetical protein
MDPVYTAGLAVHPELEALDWPKQRLVAAGALRAAELLVVEPNRGLRAARRLMDPRPLIGSELAQLDEWTRGERYPLEKDLAGRSWPILAEVVRGRQRDLGKKLARIDQRLADRLYAAAVTTMREALKRAGVKAKVRARNRAKDAQAQLDEIGMTDAVLAAINVRADELLDRSFEAYGVDARDWISTANRARRKAIAQSWEIDPDDLDDPDEGNRTEQAAAVLLVLLLGRARAALATTSPAVEPVVQVPFALVRTAMRVRDGATALPGPKGIQLMPATKDPVAAMTKQAATLATPLPDLEALARGEEVPVDLAGVVPALVKTYEWAHAYFGEPKTPFEPHLALDGEIYTEETRDMVLAKDPSEWPEGAYQWSVDDHDSCTCYEIVTWEPPDE